MASKDIEEKVKQFQELIDKSNYIVFFGGAGVSTASGIPDFRSEEGLYNNGGKKYKYSPEMMLSHTFYEEYTDQFFDFYKEQMCALGYEPCITHKRLAELEKAGKLKAIVTQNIDGLHQLAGSENVIELHGTIHKNYCQCCGKEFDAKYIKNYVGIPRCDMCEQTTTDKDSDDYVDNIVKPFVTLYEEMLPDGIMDEAIDYISRADLLIIAGTSLSVYPAAGLVDYYNGKDIVLLNKSHTDSRSSTTPTLEIYDDMNKVFEKIHA